MTVLGKFEIPKLKPHINSKLQTPIGNNGLPPTAFEHAEFPGKP
jgi:hypothetical protein